MKFHVLGPLRLFEDDVFVQLSGIKRRAALGYLLLHANSVVATSELVTALWGENPPPTARKILQNAISGLRRTLPAHSGDPDSELLVTHAPGYLLRVDPECVDLLQFRALAKRGQAALAAGRWHEAERDLRGALELWRGPALSDLLEDGYDWPELTALQNERFAVLESQMEAALAAGKEQQVISELEPVVGADPLRERLARQLMLALYRSGRQVDALGVYRRTRSALVEGLGLDPSPDLRALERAILDHDPGLALGATEARPATPPVVAGTPPPPPDALRWPRAPGRDRGRGSRVRARGG
ncbi:AfsR/SARP family transcriptional regulator, partial [Streptomyces sp. MN03-5084-2B]|nr:AfsR/SARP family transcriptional regulator [Streptomyces sp. MN03-5084-2B]